jgi:uncharacterized phage infection (PIP) family protein YhgE
MPDLNPLQSEHEVGLKFNAFMGSFQDFATSYTIAAVLMQHAVDQLIQLSLIQQTVKLLGSQLAGKNYTGDISNLRSVEGKLESRLSGLYQGIASFQLTQAMQNSQQSSTSAAILQKGTQALDRNINRLNEINKHLKTLAPDAAKKYLDKLARGESPTKVKDEKDKGVDNDKSNFKPTKRR